MKSIEVYDPPMCCSTGVCGTDTDPQLAQFAGDLLWAASEGVNVTRFNLSQQPQAFVESAPVLTAMQTRGTDVLPIILVDGVLVTQSIYPTREQLAKLAGIDSCCNEESDSGCCGESSEGKGGCCS